MINKNILKIRKELDKLDNYLLEIIKKLTSLKRRNKVLVTMLIYSLAVIFILLLYLK